MHICGNTSINIEEMISTGTDAIELDYKTDVIKAYTLMKDKTVFIGNVRPSGVLALGTTDLVRQRTIEILNVFSKTNYFILNTGCALPSITPEDNIKTFIQTVREYK
jgi:uroporphyrinogen decarboxylase